MIQKSKNKWFEVWGNEVAQNQILKYLLLVFAFANSILAISLVRISLKTPPIFAVSSIDTGILRNNPPPKEYLESEAKRVITAYLQFRHTWDQTNIQESISKASKFVDESFRKSFAQANETQVKIAVEKKITQKFYVSKIELNLEKGFAVVSGDRLLTIDGFRAVNSLSFNLNIRLGERTILNPEGVYITSEQLIESGKESK